MATLSSEFPLPLACPLPTTTLGGIARRYPPVAARVTFSTRFDGGGRCFWHPRQRSSASRLSAKPYFNVPVIFSARRNIPCFPWPSSPLGIAASKVNAAPAAEERADAEVAQGYTMTEFCDKMIHVFLHEKPRPKDWRKLLVFRDEWKKYRQSFYRRLQVREQAESDAAAKQKLASLAEKIRKVDEEIETYSDLLEEIQQNPKDIDAIVARRRREFTGDLFRHITALSETHDTMEDRDAMARLGARCLAAVSAYDNAVRNFQDLQEAQSKLDDVLNSSSLEIACEKIKSLAKAKELDSSLILLINQTWAAAKASKTIKNEAKEIMRQIYKATQKSLKTIAPPEIKLLKYLLNIVDPEERFSALATAFCPGNERETKDADVIYTTPKELHKWIKIILDAHQLNKEETEMRNARVMADPVVIQRLFILKETIEEEYLNRNSNDSSGS